ncbi:MAG: sulfotransferase [Humibacillus sp.]|nr:sulfotransferase [Humibacillus sp.]MDN5778338.1 sulfotransferase [Humibacillus sp.]
MTGRLPNFLHLGAGKAGSTWLHEVLSLHPSVYLSEAKDLYYFSRYYSRGTDWYREQFAGAGPQHRVVGEVCPDYLASPHCADRVAATLGTDVRLMVTLREPAERAYSSYLYLSKHGLAAPTFRQTAHDSPELIDEGRYGSQLADFARVFGAEAIHVALFDDLQNDPQGFLDGVTDWLGLERQPLSPEQLEAQLPASKARFLPLARAAQRSAEFVRQHDGAKIVGRVKRSALVQSTLYRQLGDDRPQISPEDLAWVRSELDGEVSELEQQFGVPVRARWNW